jgi:hypothetical protein
MKEQIKRGILPAYAEIISVFPEDSAILGKAMEVKMPIGVGAEDYAETLMKKIRIARLEEKKRRLQQQMAQSQDKERTAVVREIAQINQALHKLK